MVEVMTEEVERTSEFVERIPHESFDTERLTVTEEKTTGVRAMDVSEDIHVTDAGVCPYGDEHRAVDPLDFFGAVEAVKMELDEYEGDGFKVKRDGAAKETWDGEALYVYFYYDGITSQRCTNYSTMDELTAEAYSEHFFDYDYFEVKERAEEMIDGQTVEPVSALRFEDHRGNWGVVLPEDADFAVEGKHDTMNDIRLFWNKDDALDSDLDPWHTGSVQSYAREVDADGFDATAAVNFPERVEWEP